jgi:putative FmdB family regulatory protein
MLAGRGSAVPLYEYKCVKCGHRFEKIEPVSASEVKKCPDCGGRAERQLAAPAIQFKGSGWYVTDYAGKGSSASSPKEGTGDGAAAKSGDKAEKSSGESKSSTSDKASTKKKK